MLAGRQRLPASEAFTSLPMSVGLLCRQEGSAKAASASKPAATAWDWCHKFDLTQQTPLEETPLQVRLIQRPSSLLASGDVQLNIKL